MMGKGPVTEGSLARKQVIIIEADKAPRSQKLRVAAYARVSSDSDDQMNSFLAQTRYYTTYITSHEEWTFVDLYADEGITGTSAEKRTEFQRLIADCKRGLIESDTLQIYLAIRSQHYRLSGDRPGTEEPGDWGLFRGAEHRHRPDERRTPDYRFCRNLPKRERKHLSKYEVELSAPDGERRIYHLQGSLWLQAKTREVRD